MEDTTRRDSLALERTRLANERTILAYMRTALALLAGGAALAKFFPDERWVVPVAGLLFVMGGLTLLLGMYRYLRVQNRLGRDGAGQATREPGPGS